MKIVYNEDTLVEGSVKEFTKQVIYGADGKTKLYIEYTLILRVQKDNDPDPSVIVKE
jgi:hypothetical protein